MRGHDKSLGLITFGGPRPSIPPEEQAFLTIVGRAAFEAAERIDHGGDPGKAAPIMTEREIECLGLLVQGHSDRQIAKILGISETTVRFHIGNAREKTGAVACIQRLDSGMCTPQAPRRLRFIGTPLSAVHIHAEIS